MSTFFLGVFVFLNLLSVVFSENQALGFYGEIRIFFGLIFFGLIVKFSQPSKLAVWFVASLWIPAFLALWQFLTQATFANKWLGLAQHQASLGGTSVVETFSDGIVSGRWLRAYGSFDHPNIFGGVVAVGLLVSLSLLLNWQKEKIIKKIFLYFSIVILSAGLFASLSRSAWLALALGIVFMGTSLFFQKNFVDLKKVVSVGVVIAAVFLVMTLGYGKLINVRVEGGTRLENLSLDQREVYLQQAKTLILQKPIIGVGIGNYIPALMKIAPNKQGWEYQPVHNVLLLIWVELGILGSLSFIGLLTSLFWKLGSKNELPGALLVALLPMLLLDHWIWSFHYGILFFALVVSLAVGFSGEKR